MVRRMDNIRRIVAENNRYFYTVAGPMERSGCVEIMEKRLY